ncbi:hypothetical protein HCO18_004304 [Salmonella enterica]|nr:hypothetical protein [Salmonella enterica subsp. enterica serovar Javiana]EEP9293633.1 hypothetical protein [Salmonella enterica]EGX7302442.1 hypothetical protein [Salmonella enterica]EGX8329236.1 hypothetical protein [Salmonella enterica subsp. enterica serovar Javiana]
MAYENKYRHNDDGNKNIPQKNQFLTPVILFCCQSKDIATLVKVKHFVLTWHQKIF